MAVWTEIFQNSSEIKTKNTLEIKGQDSVEITNSGTKSIESSSNMFVLSSSGIYTGNMSGSIPTWLDDAITTEVANGTAPISQSVDDLDTYVKNMETGINQDVVNLQNEDQSLNALITINKTESDNSLAAISDTLVTKITADDATTISQQVMASEFSDPNSYISSSAWFLQNVKAYSDATIANTTSINSLSSVINDPNTGVTAVADIIKTGFTTVGLNDDGTLSATANQSEYISAAIGPQKVSIDSNDNVTVDANGNYSAVTSKLITGADGAISGWTNSNYDNRSDFTIQSNIFNIQSPDGRKTPFSIDTDTSLITLTGDVIFKGLGISGNSTSIDGGKLTVGSEISSPVINGGVINGGVINGVNINGSVIKSSWIDYTTTGGLTNWQYYGPVGNTDGYPEVPSAYEQNFAHDSKTGSIIVDSLGYVRLPTTVPLTVPGAANLASYDPGYAGPEKTLTIPSNSNVIIHPYNSYTSGSTVRVLDSNSSFTLPTASSGSIYNIAKLYFNIDDASNIGNNSNSAFEGKLTINFFGSEFILYFHRNGFDSTTDIYVSKDGVKIFSHSATEGFSSNSGSTWTYTFYGITINVSMSYDVAGHKTYYFDGTIGIAVPDSGVIQLNNYNADVGVNSLGGYAKSWGLDVGNLNQHFSIEYNYPIMKFL